MEHFALVSGWAKRLSTDVPPVMVLRLGISELAAWADTDNEVIPSSRPLFLAVHKEAEM